MSKPRRELDNTPKPGPSVELRSQVPGIISGATLAGVALLILLSYLNWQATLRVQRNVEARLVRVDERLVALSNRAPAPAQRGPDPSRVYTVKTDGAPFKGPAGAPVSIVEFTDFQCPFCGKVGPTLDQIQKVYGDQVRIVWKNFPLDFHKDAPFAHLSSLAAERQGKFWELHDKLFVDPQKLKPENVKQYAKDIGLDMARFEKDVYEPALKAKLEADMAEGKALGVTGTPAFFINGRHLSGAKPFDEFAQVINAELKRLNLPVPAGADKPAASPQPGG